MYALGAEVANKKEDIYKCGKHGIIDCKDCFDWEGLILKSVGLSDQSRVSKKGVGRENKKIDINDVY